MNYEQTIAKIRTTHLGLEDHGIFSLTVTLDYGGTAQAFGPISLGGRTDLIQRVLQATGVNSWEKIPGRTVYAVRLDVGSKPVIGLAPLPTEPGKGFVLGEDGQTEDWTPPPQ